MKKCQRKETMPDLSGVERRYRLPLLASAYLLAGYGFIHSIEGDFSCQGKVSPQLLDGGQQADHSVSRMRA
jgi:hypothetical protein